MSVRINLLPEARIIRLKNQQTKRLTTIIALLVSSSVGATLIILLLLLGARSLQKSNNEKTISELKSKITAKKNIEQDSAWFNSALTAAAATSDRRILISQLFDRLIEALPRDVQLSDITVDPEYKVKASVQALDFKTVDLFGDALRSYNLTNRYITGLEKKSVFTNIKIDSVSSAKSGAKSRTKLFDVTFTVDKDLVQKFREDNKNQSTGKTN